MDWKECWNKLIVKNVKHDEELVKSLIKSSENKLKSEKMLKLSDITAASKLSLSYDSLRELLEAIALRHGYKIYNHECYTAFLKEIIKNSKLGDEFDNIRKIRNAVNYYGKEISIEDADNIILKIKNLRLSLIKLFKK